MACYGTHCATHNNTKPVQDLDDDVLMYMEDYI